MKSRESLPADQVAQGCNLDYRAGFRDICDSDEFVQSSMVIVENVRDDLEAGKRYPAQVNDDLHKVRNAIHGLHRTSWQRLSINLSAICGDYEEGQRVLNTFVNALNQDMPSLDMDNRRGLVGSVFGLFFDHKLPINRSATGPLWTYFERIKEATACPWSVDSLTRDTYQVFRDGWTPEKSPEK